MNSVWIGLGSNQGQSEKLLNRALRAIDALETTRIIAVSPAYRTPPWGVTEQAEFLNAVAELQTKLTPAALLDALLAIEVALGRVRAGERWGPRTMDLDVLAIDQQTIDTRDLQVPHPRLHERAFVLVPLHDLAPGLLIPGRGLVADLLTTLGPEARSDIKLQGALEYHRAP
jgi:2-amino-4-hydroxy-6-hydroxymethyldihydropteridine diphosphokinase